MAAPVLPRPAATLVVMRDPPGGGPPEVLMVERHAAADAAAGAHVFPGGVLEPADWGPAAVQLAPGLPPGQAAGILGEGTGGAEALGYYVAAIRETFEESGVLLAHAAGGVPEPSDPARRAEAAEARAKINRGELAFLDWLAAREWVLSAERLVYFAHWVTPEAVPRRFDTRFFLVAAPAGAEAQHDAQEVVSHRWTTPAGALEAAASGRIHMIEPTVKNLERLARFQSTEAALGGLAGQPVQRILPKLVVNAQGRRVIIFPWDPQYETS